MYGVEFNLIELGTMHSALSGYLSHLLKYKNENHDPDTHLEKEIKTSELLIAKVEEEFVKRGCSLSTIED